MHYNTIRKICMLKEYSAIFTRYFDFDHDTHTNEEIQTCTLSSYCTIKLLLKFIDIFLEEINILH